MTFRYRPGHLEGQLPVTLDADDPALIDACIALCKENWNATPLIQATDPEEAATNVLYWLRQYGDITRLFINEQEFLP